MDTQDPIDQAYAPPTASPTPDAPRGHDWMGWALLATPVVGGLAQALPASAKAGTVAGYTMVIVSAMLIAVDAHRHRQEPGGHVLRAIFLWIFFYPAYMAKRVQWGAPRRLSFAIMATVFFCASALYRPFFAEKTRAYVRCKPVGKLVTDGFTCSIEHTAGREAANVCWNLVLTCANGPGWSAPRCGHVAPHQTTPVEVPYASLGGAQACDKLTKIEVTNLVLTAE